MTSRSDNYTNKVDLIGFCVVLTSESVSAFDVQNPNSNPTTNIYNKIRIKSAIAICRLHN